MAKSFAEVMSRLAKSDAVKVPARPKAVTPAKTKAKPLPLFWNDAVHTVVPNESGMYNLNELHRISGYSASKRPSNWLQAKQAVDLVDEYSKANKLALQVRRGNTAGRGTWVIEELVYVYAMYLSTSFHKAVIDAFTAAVHGDMVKVKEIVRTAVRQEGVDIRKEFASTFMSTDARSEAIEFATDQINLAVTGKTAEGIKALTVLKMV